MTAPVLALAPVLAAVHTGVGATTGSLRQPGHRHHPVGENTDGNQESGEVGRFAAPNWPGAPCFPLSAHQRIGRSRM